jgi:hypothetical protein
MPGPFLKKSFSPNDEAPTKHIYGEDVCTKDKWLGCRGPMFILDPRDP